MYLYFEKIHNWAANQLHYTQVPQIEKNNKSCFNQSNRQRSLCRMSAAGKSNHNKQEQLENWDIFSFFATWLQKTVGLMN